jgi:starvation-inducible DNA-binding protein
MHLFFESQYKQIQEFIDQIAERIRSLGHVAPGSMAELLKLTRLKELPGATSESPGFIAALLADQESIVRSLRESIDRADKLDDIGTSDFLTGLMEDHEQMAWMLRATAS